MHLKNIFVAIARHDIEEIKYFLPDHLEDRDEYGHTPLGYLTDWCITARYKSFYNIEVQILDLLIDNKADLNAVDNDGRTPLYNLCWRGNYDMAETLIRNGADPMIADSQGKTAFDESVNNAKLYLGRDEVWMLPAERLARMRELQLLYDKMKSGLEPEKIKDPVELEW